MAAMETTDWGTPPALIPPPQPEGDAPGELPGPGCLVKIRARPEGKPRMLDSGKLMVHLD